MLAWTTLQAKYLFQKTIYKYFTSKGLLIAESTVTVNKAVYESIETIVAKNYNAIEENFEIRKMFKAVDSSAVYQLKKQYPEVYNSLLLKEVYGHCLLFKQNIEKGIQQGLYRKDINYRNYFAFYYPLIFGLNDNIYPENVSHKSELEAIAYHTKLWLHQKELSNLKNKYNT